MIRGLHRLLYGYDRPRYARANVFDLYYRASRQPTFKLVVSPLLGKRARRRERGRAKQARRS